MDYSDFVNPRDFCVRYYDDKLQYTSHRVVPYKTSSPVHLIYKVMRSPDKIDMWLAHDSVVTQLNINGCEKHQHFSLDCSLSEIICGTLSQKGKLVVVADDLIQPGLF